MKGLTRAKIRRLWEVYLIPGYIIGGIKFVSVFTWFFYQPTARMFGVSHQSPGIIESAGTLLVGLLGAGLAMIAWPAAIYIMLSGSASVSEVLLYPWVLPTGSVSWQ